MRSSGLLNSDKASHVWQIRSCGDRFHASSGSIVSMCTLLRSVHVSEAMILITHTTLESLVHGLSRRRRIVAPICPQLNRTMETIRAFVSAPSWYLSMLTKRGHYRPSPSPRHWVSRVSLNFICGCSCRVWPPFALGAFPFLETAEGLRMKCADEQ